MIQKICYAIRMSFASRFSSRSPRSPQPTRQTSWEGVAGWYGHHLKNDDSLHRTVVIPNTLRLLDAHPHELHLDIACGEGNFTRILAASLPQEIIGIDASPSLIQQAKRQSPRNVQYFVGDARRFSEKIGEQSVDHATCLLALQNMDPCADVFREAHTVLRPQGSFVFVLNHPCFRQPRQSGWGWDEERKLQYRRVDRYLSSYEMPIFAHPGSAPSAKTLSFHHPLSYYVQALTENGFVIDALEEWISPKTSDSGPKARAENVARIEIPLFLAIRAVKR
jgi:ubiquinone/menaquinone biosynthesis C-methylase UbiE